MGTNTYSYAVVPGGFNEDFYEQCVIEHMTDKLGYTHLYGPDVERTSDEYRDVFLPGILEDSLARINKGLPAAAIDEAILKRSKTSRAVRSNSATRPSTITCNRVLRFASLMANESVTTLCAYSTLMTPKTTTSTSLTNGPLWNTPRSVPT